MPRTLAGVTTAPRPRATAPAAGALETFLRDIEQKAYRFAHYELWDRDAALDAVQDSMLRLATRYRDRPPSEWPALFFTILRHRTVDAQRARRLDRLRGLFGGRRRSDADDNEAASWEQLPAPAHEGPETVIATAQQRRALDAALQQLPARQRQVFLLRELQELSSAETAQVLGCSVGAVKQHHFRALTALRALLTEGWNHDRR
ncbi:MAG: RNA polymerase sigma factor [Gammaproteobacteria bacterium]